jgi:hypothetical protein
MRDHPHVSLPLSDHLTLLEATLLFGLQMLLARHPDLLAPPEQTDTLRPTIPLYGARRLLAAIRELNHALEQYREALHDRPNADDDILF